MAESFAELQADLLSDLQAALSGDWWIAPAVPLDDIVKPTLYAVWTGISKDGQAQGWLSNTFSVWLIFPVDMPEADISEHVQTAQQALDDSQLGGHWREANRVIFGSPGFPAWQFDFTAPSRRKAPTTD